MTTDKLHPVINGILTLAWVVVIANVVCVVLNLTSAVTVLVSIALVLIVVLVALIIWDCVLHRKEVWLQHDELQRNVDWW